jgi:glucosyl-3-phosphoglycerate phosphatase
VNERSPVAPVRRLWLVRHGETEGQSSIRFHGRNDVRLSDVGRAQIRALRPLLQHVPFVRIVHSPLQRAAESAAILAAECGLGDRARHADERLREISFGACEGMTQAEIEVAFPGFWDRHRQGFVDRFPDGEPRPEFAARVAAAMHELAAADWSGDLLVVSHRGTVRHALRALLAVPAHEPDEFGVELASVSIVRSAGAGWQLEALGRLP